MIKNVFRTLGLFKTIRCILMTPYVSFMYYIYEKKHRKTAESMGLTFEEYRKRMIVHHDGTPLTEYEWKQYEAEHRAYELERLKKEYGYKDF